jgi:two-component system chemotaxis sensor kinase CheA
MDVVKTNLDRLGGKVDIQTQLGKGTVFRIKLPLTLAIIPSLIVSIEGERFAIPQINIEELLRIQPGERKNRIGVVGGVEVLLLRDRMLPLISLASPSDVTRTYTDSRTGVRELDRRTRLADRRSPRFGATEEVDLSGSSTAEKDRRASEDRRQRNASVLEVAVVTTGTMSFGLVVDAFHDSEEIVVKPLGRHLKPLKEYAGATILGDGRVALILDAAGLAAKADLISRARPENARIHGPAAEGTEQSQFLLFHNSPGEVCGVPLDLVERIERITPDQLQGAAGRRTIQYRGASLPLLALSDVAQVKPVSEDLDLVAIVSRIRGREIGLLGARPVDVVEASVLLDGVTHRQPGIAGSAIVRDQTILITDLLEIVDSVYPEWGKAEAASSTPMPGGGRACVLLADDSDFFRGQVRRYLEEDAYTVLEAPDGEAAWEMLLSHQEEIQMVVTDVEMPRLSGLGLAQRIRSDPRTAALPVIALSSLAGEEDLARGREAGASEYLIKLDRDRLLAAVRDQLATLTSTGAKGARPSHASLT